MLQRDRYTYEHYKSLQVKYPFARWSRGKHDKWPEMRELGKKVKKGHMFLSMHCT